MKDFIQDILKEDYKNNFPVTYDAEFITEYPIIFIRKY